MMAALASTMQAVSKDRFVLGLGRGADAYIDTAGRAISSLAGTADYATILRRMWAGEDFAYDGPAGSWSRLRQPDPYQGPPAELLLAAIGDKALAVGGRHYDSVMFHPIMTPAAVRRAVDIVGNAAADAGRDPASVRTYAPVLVAPELSEEETILRVHARAVTYLTVPAVGRLLTINNGWSLDDLTRLQNHEQFHALRDDDVPDLTFWRKDLLAPARSMPRHWMDETCAIGSIDDCIARLREFLTAGADELILHSALPHQLAPLVRKWREDKAEKVSA
jgi:probable F420-dependent oxidoreductase